MMRTVYPEKVTGYELNIKKGFFAVIYPKEATNLCPNPSGERNTTYWGTVPSAGGPALSRTDAEQRRGAYSFTCTPGVDDTQQVEGMYAIIANSSTDQTYSVTVDVKGHPGVDYVLFVSSAAAPQLSTLYSPVIHFNGKGYWQRIKVIYSIRASISVGVAICELNTHGAFSGKPFYTDGMLVEEGEIESTYFDGDSKGFIEDVDHFLWNGLPHASTSWRSGQTRAGGSIYPLKNVGLDVLSYMGLGKSNEKHVLNPLGLVGGSYYQRSIPGMREYTIVGAITKDDYKKMKLARSDLEEYFTRQEASESQPILVRFQDVDDCGDPIGDPLHLPSLYIGGLEAEIDNLYQDRVAINLAMPKSEMIVDGENGDGLDIIWGSTTMYAISQRDLDVDDDYIWQNMSNGLDGEVRTMAEGLDGYIYVGGEFTNIRPATAAYRTAYWNGTNWNDMGVAPNNGLNGAVNIIVVGPNNIIYIGGEFDDLQGGAGGTYPHVIQFNPATGLFSAMAGGLAGAVANAQVFDMAIDPTTGYLWAVHTYDSAGNLRGRISYWDGAAWNTARSASTNEDFYYAIAISKEGLIYVAGESDDVGANESLFEVSEDGGTTWTNRSYLDGGIYDLAIGDNGILYMCGMFRGGYDSNNYYSVAGYRGGNSYFNLGNGLELDAGGHNNAGGLYYRNGLLYVTGARKYIANGAGNLAAQDLYFDITGGINHEDSYAVWNLSTWIRPDFIINAVRPIVNQSLPTAPVLIDRHGNQYLAATASVSPTTVPKYSVIIDIDNDGSTDTFPVLELTTDEGCILYWLRNETTDETIYFNQNISVSEYLTLNLEDKTFFSNIHGSVLNGILRGSDFAKFHLKPGSNRLTLFVGQLSGSDSDTYGRIWWKLRHDYSSGAILR